MNYYSYMDRKQRKWGLRARWPVNRPPALGLVAYYSGGLVSPPVILSYPNLIVLPHASLRSEKNCAIQPHSPCSSMPPFPRNPLLYRVFRTLHSQFRLQKKWGPPHKTAQFWHHLPRPVFSPVPTVQLAIGAWRLLILLSPVIQYNTGRSKLVQRYSAVVAHPQALTDPPQWHRGALAHPPRQDPLKTLIDPHPAPALH